jgi:hypothetical protein
MYYNPETERAVRSIEQQAAENRKIIEKLSPPIPNAIVWSSLEGRWIPNPEAQLTYGN